MAVVDGDIMIGDKAKGKRVAVQQPIYHNGVEAGCELIGTVDLLLAI